MWSAVPATAVADTAVADTAAADPAGVVVKSRSPDPIPERGVLTESTGNGSAAGVAGAALGLVIVGATLTVVVRRRRVTEVTPPIVLPSAHADEHRKMARAASGH